MKFILTFVFIWVVISPAIGSESEVDVCEYEDAILLFPNTQVSFVGDIRAKTWNKDKDIRLASWMAGGKFTPLLSYEDRLMAIGENSIKIRNVTRSDTGMYTLFLTSGSAQVFFEHTSHLNVKVPPKDQCIPKVTREGDVLVAVLQPNDCGIPSLIPEWMNTNQTVIRSNISVLNLEPGRVLGMYTACAVGKSLSCFHGDANKLCFNYTVSALQSQNTSSPVSLEGIISVINFYVVIGAVLFLVCWKWDFIRKKLFPVTETSENDDNHDEESHLMTEETATKDIAEGGRTVPEEELLKHITPLIIDIKEVKRHLIDQYKTMNGVSLSPCYEENSIDVSQVYCELEITHLAVQDYKCRQKLEAETVTSENDIFSSIDTEKGRPIPALLLGECGSGKTTWCKNLVDQWCQYHKHKESNSGMTDSSIPNFAKFEILLYIPLKQYLEVSSFTEHLRKMLFANAPDYCDFTMKCIYERRETVIVLIDGFDEVICNHESIVNLLKENTIVPCLIVLTSRPNGLKYLQRIGISLRLFQIQGMSPDKSKQYASKVLDVLCRDETLNIDHFWKFVKHMQLQSMCNTPPLCLSLILFWINSKTVSNDLTEVILTILEGYLRRAMAREWYRANINTDVGELDFDISKFIATRPCHYLTEHSYLLKIISVVAENMWCLKKQFYTDEESKDTETTTKCNWSDIELCLETGILITSIREVFRTKRAQITFSHTLLFDFFVALSIAMGKRELFTRYITTKDDVINNCYMIHMLCQIAPNIGQDLIKDISKIYDKKNDKVASKKTEESEQQLICKVKSKKGNRLGETPGKWLQRLICTDKLSNETLSILTDGMAFVNDLTNFHLELLENRNELIIRLPILPKLKVLRIVIENCTLLLQEERKWDKVKLLNLRELVIKSVHVDVTTTGYIFEAICCCKHLITLEFCPQDDSNKVVVAPGSLMPFYSWGCLAKAIKDMNKLKSFRLHNIEVGEHLPALIDILCRSPMIEILDLMNLKETEEIPKLNSSVQGVSACRHHETKFTKITHKTLHLTKNEMSEKSWLILSERLESLSPYMLHIEQVHQSNLVLKKLLQGIGKCTDLNILSICSIRVKNESVSFSDLRPLHKLTKLALCKIDIPDPSWRELSYILARLPSLKEISLACLQKPNCFIKVRQISKLKFITVTQIHLEEALWSKLGDEVIVLPKLKRLEFVSCIMSQNGLLIFQQKMNESGLFVETAKTFQTEDSEMLSVDMIVSTKKTNKSKDAKTTYNLGKDEFKPNTVSIV
ncbi:hypothetical protein CHS0354_032895 [Potamilus streckersoni]|uniref:NACHT domain-containing protein n=1 Tax=Potamilus streckersoni TaxID=2493646 RepID=A0AAE0RWE5_9BIVA|nr:hypothetical protein CHS0354_032895 [Potamilus streckersoni]